MTGEELQRKAYHEKLLISVAEAQLVMLDLEFAKLQAIATGNQMPVLKMTNAIGRAQGNLEYDLSKIKGS